MRETGERHSRTERGASAVEYGLLVASTVAALLIVVFMFSDAGRAIFKAQCDDIGNVPGHATSCAKTN